MVDTTDCALVHRALRERGGRAGRLGDDRALADHLAQCPACAALQDGAGFAAALDDFAREDHESKPGQDDDLDRRYAALAQALDQPITPAERIRQAPTRARAAGLGLTALALFAGVLVATPRVDLDLLPLPRLLGTLAVFALVVVAAGVCFIRPLHRGPIDRRVTLATAAAAFLGPLLVCALPAAHRDLPASLEGVGADFLPRAAGCFGFGMAFALLTLAAAWLIDRRAKTRSPMTAGLALLGAGALANAVLLVHCPLVEPLHKFGGHGSVSIALLAVTAAAAAWLTRRRLG